MKDSRLYKRYGVKCCGQMTDDHYRKFRFQVNDMSAGGMSITTDKEMENQSKFIISFDPSGILLPHTKRLEGVVVRKMAGTPTYKYGVCFYGLSHTEIIEIDEYLHFSQKHTPKHIVDNSEVSELMLAYTR